MGLSGRVLQKVRELQVHHERLSRENKQKQLLLDNIQTSLEKQTVKYEEVRAELQSSHRELQSVREEAKVAVTNRERLSLDLQTKQAQVCSLEGQLDAARSLNNKLTQEVKRLEAELEKLHNSSRSADATLFSTPCWSTTSPWEFSGRKEERHGNRDEEKTQGLHIRRLQFSDMPTGSLPHQPRNTPHRQPPDGFSTPLTAFPWERDDSKPAARRQSPVTPKTPYSDALSQNQSEQDLRGRENSCSNSEKDSSLSELRSRFTDLEEQLRVKAETLKSIQNEVAQNKKDLAAKELNLQKLQDELSLAHTRMAQESERASGAEQRAKQLQEELKCQRQNSESIRVQHQQRTKELERQHQRDLQEFQKERQYMERQHQQEINKLNQELAQARTLHNALQAQADKVSLQKQALDKEVDTLKEKLKWTEGQLQQSQKKEAQTQAKLTEALREAEAVTVSLKLSQKKEKTLEEDGRRLTEERDHAQYLLKELQEQKAAMVPLQQTLQFPQSLSTQSSHPSPPQPLRQTRRPTTTNLTKQKRDEEDRRGEMTVSYPTDREPGEGIDSEHISDLLSSKPESLHREEPRIQSKEEEVFECDSSQTDRLHSEKTPPLRSKQVTASEDLQAENAALRSELRDVREELQKRLDDLEAQRRAETEARTRLKQLSRKNANQVTEKEEQYKECRTQLEKEKSEVERLKKALAVLETEIVRERQERDVKKQEVVIDNMTQDREDEMIELNMQLKKQLSEVKSQLALEREERTQEEEEMRKKTSTDSDLKTKLAELQAEIEQLKGSRNNISQEEKLSVANSPLTYLTLGEDELNSNIDVTNKPEHLLFCQSTNQRNMMLSQAARDYIQPEGTLIDPQYSPVTDSDSERELPASSQEDTLPMNNLGKAHDEQRELFDLHPERSSDLVTQVQRLQKQNAIEKERANQYRIKLEALQSQVTRQTQQLTMAFEKQSQHISGLLAELQEKECALLSTAQELQQCKGDLSVLKAEINKEEVHNHNTEEAAFAFSIKNVVTDNNVDPQRGLQLTSDVESQVVDSSPKAVIKCSVESDNTVQEEQDLGDVGEIERRAVITAELFNLQQENQLLKLKIEALTATELSGKNTGDGSVPCPEEQTPTAVSDVTVQARSETQQSNIVNSSEHTEESEEQPEAVSQRLDQLSYLQQQVVALQTKLQALFEENQQKTQELALWRLASEPAPIFVQSPASTESDTLGHVQGSAAGNPQSYYKHGTEHGQAEPQKTTQESNGCVTFVREDELHLSCSTNKLQGRTLFSRIQHNVTSEAKTHHPFTRTLSTQEPIQDHPESDKENTRPTQQIQKKDSEHVTKDVSRGLGLQQTETIDCPTVNLASTELKPTSFSIKRCVGADMRCVSTQTERLSVSPELQCVHTQTEVGQGKEEMVDSPSLSPVAFVEDQQTRDKMMLTGSFPIPADPARLAERIRRNRTQLSAAFDDTEYEPYGLPEVVMKGFADIPTGPSCPYIVRRGLLGTAAVPVPQRNVAEAEETD